MISLERALAALPGTADGIAARFAEQGIRGVPADSYCCPVANYLIAAGFTAAQVGDIRIEACDDDCGSEEVVTPKPVADFLKRFDSHAWPALIQDQNMADALLVDCGLPSCGAKPGEACVNSVNQHPRAEPHWNRVVKGRRERKP